MRCKESKLEIDVSKYERMIKENGNIYELMKGLEELDLAYTKAKVAELVNIMEAISTTYKNIMNEDLQNKLEEYKKKFQNKSLHNSEFEKIKDEVENIYIDLKNDPKLNAIKPTTVNKNSFKGIKLEIGNIVYDKNRDSYGVILNKNEEDKLYEIYSFETNKIYEGVSENELSAKSGKIRKGIINGINNDGSYNITYEDGGFDFNVKEDSIRISKDKVTNLKTEAKQFRLIGKNVYIKIGEYYKLIIGSIVYDVQVVKIEGILDKISVNYNNQYILTNISISDLHESDYIPSLNAKYKIMDVVEVIDAKEMIQSPCYVIYSNRKEKGRIIGFNEKLNKPIIDIEYIKRVDIKDILYESQYLEGDIILYKDKKEKWFETEIQKINDCSISIISDDSSNKLISYTNIHPYFCSNYQVFTKVNVHFNEKCVLPGIVLSYNRDKKTYDILLLNKYFLHDIPHYMIYLPKLKMNDEVLFIQKGKLITKGRISLINDNGKYSITNNEKCYENIFPRELHLLNDYNYRIGMRVSAFFEKNYYKGKINEIRYKLINESEYELQYGVLFDDGEYKYVNEDNIHPYNDSNTLYVVGDRIANVNGEKGVITKVEDENNYSILYDNGRYNEDVIVKRIRRDLFFVENKYNIGDIVTKDSKEYKVIFVYYNENCYDLEENGNFHQILYRNKEKDLSLKAQVNRKYRINERVKYNYHAGFIHSIMEDAKYIICVKNEDEEKYNYLKNVNENMIKKVDDYDNERNEFNLKVGSVIRYGIKPSNVRKLVKERKIIKHTDYNPTLSRFYVDEELGIDEPCQVLSCDEYNTGEKEYIIKYKGIIKTVDETKLEISY